MTTSTDAQRVALDADASQALTASAHSARFADYLLRNAGPIVPGSKFDALGGAGGGETVEYRVRNYLLAAVEHLRFWADSFAPLVFHPDQTVEITLRPSYTLARAAIEAASQALWMMNSTDQFELHRRYLAMVNWELTKQTLSSTGRDKDRAAAEKAEFLQARANVAPDLDLSTPGGYGAFVRSAASANGVNLDADELDQMWRRASGVAHGHLWVNEVLTELRPIDPVSPTSPVLRTPTLDGLCRIHEVAAHVVQIGVLNYLDFLGADIAAKITETTDWFSKVVPLTDESRRSGLFAQVRLMATSGDDTGAVDVRSGQE